MTRAPEVVAVIPARGQSKGLPRKNCLPLCGKPLIAYSIETALRSRLIDRVIVSTDDEEIAAIARDFGASVPALRPESLARDASELTEVVKHAMLRLYDGDPDQAISIVLLPTHPFRTPTLVDYLTQKLLDGAHQVITARSIRFAPGDFVHIGEDGRARRNASATTAPMRACRPYGLFIGGGGPPQSCRYVYVIKDKISLIDIDTEADLRLAERVVSANLFDFQTS